ncbi:MAG TPA: hypothetical protein VFF67_06900 [Thermoplasmata archaeon]|nr:hypothetical protein [Thermoplasmata archaeon]
MVERSRDLRERAFHILLLLVGAAALASGLFNLLVVGDASPPTIFDAVLGLAILLVTWLFVAPELAPRLLGPVEAATPQLVALAPESEPGPEPEPPTEIPTPAPTPWAEPPAPRSPPAVAMPAAVASAATEDASAELLEAIQRVIDPPAPAAAPPRSSPPATRIVPSPTPPVVAGEVVKELDAMYRELQPAAPVLRSRVGPDDRRRGRPAPSG